MKVVWITSVYPSSEQPGSGVFHETQVQALIDLGIEVTVICPVPMAPALIQHMRKKYRANKHIPLVYNRNGVTVYRPPYTALPGQLRWAQPDSRIATAVLKTMADYNIDADLIHAHFAMPSGGAAKRVAQAKNLPWVLTLHGSDVNVYPHYSKGAMKAFLQSVKSADTVISVGSILKEKAKELSGRDSFHLPIGVDLSRFQPPKQFKLEVRRQLGLPLDKKIVLFVGRLTEAKGVFELAKALEDLPEEVAAAYVGDGPAYKKLKSHPECNQRIFLTGQVENSNVIDYLFASDVFALPSYTEGMPTVVIEALALKIPVICSAVGGVPELFGQHSSLLIEPQSVESLSERIRDYLYRDINLTKIGHELYCHIQEHYDASKNAAVLGDIYSRMLESDGRLSGNTK
ncbi:teichuronic acid biosynthesis protein TuaC [Peribacillus deserti]|uniref:Glycosyltransferase family 4 protein n=1 Tax=Peribacillus deserti TaxID=673318 RepID=A0A2N5MBU4_9BACI|nr:glycosyltransferase family 4 protein [Peribacillus deserti]PLT31817.1 glycosyltransferase family 4 protein [Peribacillus deserti]